MAHVIKGRKAKIARTLSALDRLEAQAESLEENAERSIEPWKREAFASYARNIRQEVQRIRRKINA